MSAVTIRYFIADAADPSIAHIVEQARDDSFGRANRQQALANELGAKLFMMRAGNLTGFCYQNKADVPAGMRLYTTTTYEGKPNLVVVPDRRTKVGKEIAKRLEEANWGRRPFSEAVCRDLGIYDLRVGADSSSRTGMSMYETVCGLVDGKVIFKIPFGGSQGGMVETKDPLIPDCFKEIEESEFNAISKEAGHA